MDVKSDEEGGKVVFSCNVAGYRPEELKVDVERRSRHQRFVFGLKNGCTLHLLSNFSDEHKEKHGGQTVHRTFHRSIALPEGVVKESIQCNLDEKGIEF